MRRSYFEHSTYTQAPRFVVAAAFLVYALVSNAAQADCPSHWRKLASRSIKIAKVTASIPYHVAKATFYVPVVYPFKVLNDLGFEGLIIGDWKAARAAPWKILKDDKWHLLAYSALATLQRTTGLTYNQYQNATAEFDEEQNDELRVIVNGFWSDDPAYAKAARYIFQHNRRRYRNLILVEAKDSKDLMEQLAAITAEHGKITHLDYYGHGLPGYLERYDFTGHYSVNGLGDKWAVEREHGLKDLPKHLAAGALLRFNSCFAIKGEEGEGFKDHIALGILSENGGKLFASKVQILPNAVEFAALWNHYDEPPRWLRTYGDWLSAYNGLFTLTSGLEMQFGNETKAHPFHLQTWDQLEVRPATPQQKHNRGLISGEFAQKLLAKNVELERNFLKLRDAGQLLRCAQDIAQTFNGNVTVYEGQDQLSKLLESSAEVMEEILPRIKRDCGPLLFEFGEPIQSGKVRVTVRYPQEDYSIRAATLQEFRAIMEKQERFVEELQAEYRPRLEKLFQNGHITDYDYRLSSKLLDSLLKQFQSQRDSVDRPSHAYYSAYEYKRLAASRNAEDAITRMISKKVLTLLEESSNNFWVINGQVQIFRSDSESIQKILARFPGSSEKRSSSGNMITLALPEALQSECRADAEVILDNYRKELAARTEEEYQQLQRLEADGLLTKTETDAVRRLITSELNERNPTERFSSILGITK